MHVFKVTDTYLTKKHMEILNLIDFYGVSKKKTLIK